jgi:hypothetical protein
MRGKNVYDAAEMPRSAHLSNGENTLAGGSNISPGKTAPGEEAKRYTPHFVWAIALWIDPGVWESSSSDSGILRYVEGLNNARTKPGEKRV